MVNESAELDSSLEHLFGSVVGFTRRLHATGQRWTGTASGLTRAEVALMRVVAEGECRPGAVAARLCVGPAVVSRQLAQLVRAGIVARRPDPDDGRAELLSLTPLGVRALRDLRAAHLARLRDRLDGWDEKRIRAAAELLDALADALAPPAGEPAPALAAPGPTAAPGTTKDFA